MDKLSLMYADWLVFKADFDQWLELPFEFRYSEEFATYSLKAYTTRFTQEHIELRDKDYKSIFLELISRVEELNKELKTRLLFTETTRVGRTSITVKVVVDAERWGAGQGERVRVTEAEVVLVAIGPDGVPVPIRPA